jgi:hypothetical protein
MAAIEDPTPPAPTTRILIRITQSGVHYVGESGYSATPLARHGPPPASSWSTARLGYVVRREGECSTTPLSKRVGLATGTVKWFNNDKGFGFIATRT